MTDPIVRNTNDRGTTRPVIATSLLGTPEMIELFRRFSPRKAVSTTCSGVSIVRAGGF
jgi:hypothetical protein